MMRSLMVFCAVSVLHFVLSVAGVVLALPAAFAYQHGFWAAPVKITLAWTAGVLLAPLAWLSLRGDFGYLKIAAVSVLFGLAAVSITYAVSRARRAGRRPED
jgi:hypothetical protein